VLIVSRSRSVKHLALHQRMSSPAADFQGAVVRPARSGLNGVALAGAVITSPHYFRQVELAPSSDACVGSWMQRPQPAAAPNG